VSLVVRDTKPVYLRRLDQSYLITYSTPLLVNCSWLSPPQLRVNLIFVLYNPIHTNTIMVQGPNVNILVTSWCPRKPIPNHNTPTHIYLQGLLSVNACVSGAGYQYYISVPGHCPLPRLRGVSKNLTLRMQEQKKGFLLRAALSWDQVEIDAQ